MNTYEHLWHTLTENGAIPMEIGRQLSEKVESADIAYLWEEIPKTVDQSLDGVRRVEKLFGL